MSFVDSYDYLLTIKHITLGEIDIWKAKELTQLAFSKKIPSNYPKQQLNLRSEWQHENVVELLGAELLKSNDQEHISCYYEFYEQNLQNYIYNSSRLRETEIWHLLLQIIEGALFILKKGYYTNLSTINIFYGNNHIKLIETDIIQTNLSSQLGLTLFEMITKESQYIILENQQINHQYLELMLLESKYSNQLHKILRDLLDGVSIEEIYSTIKQSRSQIINRQPIESLIQRARSAIIASQKVIQKVNSTSHHFM
ncbi:hypothetical protein pb186bvf_010777 [Paramecium bursaria]